MDGSSVSSTGAGAAASSGASAAPSGSSAGASASVTSDSHAQAPSTTGAGLAQAQTAASSLTAGSGVNSFAPDSSAAADGHAQTPSTAGAGLAQAATPGDRLREPTTADAYAGAGSAAAAAGAAAAAKVPTESEFKIGDKTFVVEGGTPAQRTDVEKDLREIFGTKRGAEMLKELESRRFLGLFRTDFKVDLNVTNNAYAPLGGDSIHVDPNFHPSIDTANGPIAATTQRIMAHELGHAVFGTADDGPSRMNNVTQNENTVMNELGEPSRTKY